MEINLGKGKTLSVFSLVMINIIAVDSLRTLPISAEYGFSLVFFYLLAGLVFFIPVSLVAAELATAWPKTGGLYVWVKEAFGKPIGFMVIWMQWIYNIVWYPTILAFISSAFAYLICPAWATNKTYLFITLLGLFWLTTFANLYGMRVSGMISAFGALVGTLLPMFIIIMLAGYWYIQGYEMAITPSWHNLFPKDVSVNSLVLFTGVLFGLVGMEMSAVHAGDVQSPQRDYPKALLFSTIIIFITLVLGSLAVALVIPQKELNLVTGFIDAFSVFFVALKLKWMIPLVVLMVIIGGLSSVSTWVLGPSKGLMVSAEDGCLPEFFFKTNRYGAPSTILIIQAIIFSILSSVFVFSESINASYWMLSALTEQLAMAVYVLMFAAAIVLRTKRSEVYRAFRIPGGNWVLYLVASIGISSCFSAIILGFFPPSHIEVKNTFIYQGFIILGLFIFVCLPWYLVRYYSNNRSEAAQI